MLLVALGCGTSLWAQTPTVKLEDPPVIARGSAIFGTTCGIGYCHGKEGRAGRGPRLAGRKLEKEYLFKTISSGVNNSLMPAFKSQLSTDEIWSVVAYILTLSSPAPDLRPPGADTPPSPGPSLAPGLQFPTPNPPPPAAGTAPTSGPSLVPEPQSPTPNPQPPAPESLPVPGPRSPIAGGDPQGGRALFFDSTNPKHCAVCHRFQGRGADVGPDLTAVGSKPPQEILQDIVEPDARLAIEPVTVATKSGERITGIKKQENRELIRIYDTRSLPPVLRTIYKDEISNIQPERRSPMPGDYGRIFTRGQLEDLIAFLKSSPQ